MISLRSDPLGLVTPWRATCNRLTLDAAVRDYDRRHARTSRRQTGRYEAQLRERREVITEGVAA